MKICNPETGIWQEVKGTTTNAIAEELGLSRTTHWQYKVNGTVQKSAPSNPSDDDVIELVDSDVETLQSEEVSTTSGDNK